MITIVVVGFFKSKALTDNKSNVFNDFYEPEILIYRGLNENFFTFAPHV